MFCSKCGMQNVSGEQFCKNCGTILNNQMLNQQPVSQGQYPNNQMSNQQIQNNNGTLNANYVNQVVNPNMKKWAILSIIVPVVGIVWYWFIGLSFYVAIFIASCGFGFAQKGEMANKKLATIGKVLNGILCGMAILMFILYLIDIFTA